VSSSTEEPEVPGAVQQAQGFAELVDTGAIQVPNNQDVFVIWIGGNDFLELEDAGVSDIPDIFRLDETIVDNIETTVDTLKSVGASNFLIVGQPTVGGAFLGTQASSGSLLALTLNVLVERYNDTLSDYVDSIDEVEGQNALYVDIASFVDDLEDDPESYGFNNVTSNIFADDAPLDDQSYFSVDGVHPTGAGHEAIANFVVETAAAANFDLTAFAGNVIPGSPRDDTLTGSQGPDTITGGPGNDQIVGGPGFDTAVYSGNQSSYTLALGPGSTMITDRRTNGDDGDSLTDMEFLDFDTGGIDLTVFGRAPELSEQALESIIELYIAMFNRAPDANGLNFWATSIAKGTTIDEVAALFMDQDETRDLYPEGTSNEIFATLAYENVLGRDPDASGLAFWVGVLDAGDITRSQFILEFLGGAPEGSSDGAYLDSKTDIGKYFAVIKGLSDGEDALAVMQLFDGTPGSVNDAVGAIDDAYADALDPGTGEFLMPLINVLDDPFAIA